MTSAFPGRDPAAFADPAPMMNTTPLIDLMLVLLVMFIVSIPIATHKVPLDVSTGPTPPSERPPAHRLDLDAAGRASWDGRPVRDAQLRLLLTRLAADPAAPELHIAVAAETRYERVDHVLAEILRAGVTRTGFIGNERFAQALDR
jgi:biopolymer transport protein ExbD